MRKAWVITALMAVIGGAVYGIPMLQRQFGKSVEPTVASQAVSAKQRDPNVHDILDVDFAKKKLLHHQLAAILADKAKTDATRPEVRALAEQMSKQETERANVYAAMLTKWNEQYYNITDFPETNGCHGYPTFSGMLPYTEVGNYRLSSGESVDKTFFAIMAAHHEANKELAKVEGRNVGYGKLIALRDESLRDYASELRQLGATRTSLGL